MQKIKLETLKFINNRKINHKHVALLSQSIKEKGQIVPIIVNEKNQIIDGQHRFLAMKNNKEKQINAIIVKHDDELISVCNSEAKAWKATDYFQFYAGKGLRDYQVVLILLEIFTELKLTHILMMNEDDFTIDTSYKKGKFVIKKRVQLITRSANLDQFFIDNKQSLKKDKKLYIKELFKN